MKNLITIYNDLKASITFYEKPSTEKLLETKIINVLKSKRNKIKNPETKRLYTSFINSLEKEIKGELINGKIKSSTYEKNQVKACREERGENMSIEQVYIKCPNCHNILIQEKCKRCGKEYTMDEIVGLMKKQMKIVIFKDISYTIYINDKKRETTYITEEGPYK